MRMRDGLTRRAVSPVIANLIIIAIAVVGGTVTFVFAQGLVNSSQVSGEPVIEFVEVIGYDARDAPQLQSTSGDILSIQMSGAFNDDGLKGKDERIIVYLQNNSVDKVTIADLRLGGVVFNYSPSDNTWIPLGTYGILTRSSPEELSDLPVAEIPPGGETSIVFALEDYVKTGRDLQLRLATTHGNIFVGTILTGQQRG